MALVGAITREVARLEALSEEYLRMARLPTPRKDGDDLAGLVADLAAFVQPEILRAQCTLTLRVEDHAKGETRRSGNDHAPRLLYDEAQIRQALANLLRNAREAMPTGGPIVVTVARTGLAMTVTVADNGEGVPDELRASIFEPFFSTKGSGTGLGLAITRQIVRAHGGDLTCVAASEFAGEIASGGPKGARFRITLPFSPSNDATDEAGLLD
jgi:signal transduction histidine kinase